MKPSDSIPIGRRPLLVGSLLALAGCGGGGGPLVLSPAAAGGDGTLPPAETPALPIPAGQIEMALTRIDGLAQDILQRTGIPGMAVAVVKDGRTVYAKGFGVRRAGTPEPVDADTVFQLASLSKPIGATVVAAVVSQGRVAWDTPVQSQLPWFALSDEAVTRQVTVGDLYAHRSGLPMASGDQLEDLGYDRRQVLERLRYVPLNAFRASYGYANFGMTGGAEAVAAAAGLDWETLSDRLLYQPLGMGATSSRFADYSRRPNRATPHVKRDGRYQPLYQRQPDAQSPAGGVSANVNDMTRWMSMLLQNGSHEGRTIIKPEALLPALKPQIVSSQAGGPAARASFYGFGFNVGTTTGGRVKLSHSGAFLLGAGTAFTAIPQAGVAIVTLTNAQPIGAAEALNSAFEDLVEFGRVTRDWLAGYEPLFAGYYALEGSLAGKTPPAQPAPPLDGNAYTGSYANAFYGNAVVEPAAGGLQLRMGPNGVTVYPLRHWDGNTFVFDLQSENAEPGSVSRIDFRPGPSGAAERLQLEYFSRDLARGIFNRSS